jgi:hypothetical protein
MLGGSGPSHKIEYGCFMISDPQTAGPRPPFSGQQQTSPGFTAKMDPNPDHGEHSYRGNGCRTAFSPSSRMPRAAPRSRPPNIPTWRLPPSAVTICRPCAAGGKDATSRFARRLDLYPEPDEAGRQRARRQRDRAALVGALSAAGIGPTRRREMGTAPALGVHRFLARSKAAIAMVQVDDLTDEGDQVNLPTTTDEHPNWRRRQKLTIEVLADDPRAFDVIRIMQEERPRNEGDGR